MQSTIEVVFSILSVITLYSSFSSAFNTPHWLIRVSDFPRLQIFFCTLACCLVWASLMAFNGFSYYQLILFALLVIAIIYQTSWVLPYLWPKQKEVKNACNKSTQEQASLSLLSSNVLQTNKRYSALIGLVHHYKPDILVTLESNMQWQEALSVIHDNYPYRVAVPQENLYGMHVYSKYPLDNPEVHYRIRDDIPSISTKIHLTSLAKAIELHFIHPMPPSPTEAEESTERDQELILLAKEVANNTQPTIVAGDLNDVAWSRTTQLFKKLSGLKDPRLGRGFFNTFHAGYPFLRWPLDHFFISEHFSIKDIRVLPNIGSDHFPIMIQLALDTNATENEKNEPEPLNFAEQDLLDDRMSKL